MRAGVTPGECCCSETFQPENENGLEVVHTCAECFHESNTNLWRIYKDERCPLFHCAVCDKQETPEGMRWECSQCGKERIFL